MKNIIENKRIFVLYIISVTIIYLCVCFAVNICKRNYIQEIKPLLSYGLIFYAILLINYFWYISVRRKNFILKRKIRKINSKINYTIKLLQTYVVSSSSNYRNYNRMTKKVNKLLTKKSISATFEPLFEEDKTVLKVISLFNNLSEKDISAQYNRYKELFKKRMGFQVLTKANKLTPIQDCVSKVKDYIALLEGTIKNNNKEIKTIVKNITRENTVLYEKYGSLSHICIEKKLIKKVVVATVCLCILFLSNLVLGKMTNSHKYDILMQYLEEKNYDEAYFLMIELDDFMDLDEMKCDLSKYYVDNNDYNKAFSLLKDIHDNASVKNDISSIRGKLGFPNGNNSSVQHWENIVSVDINGRYIIGAKEDGTVVNNGIADTSSWENIARVFTGDRYTVGLKKDGTVIAVTDKGNPAKTEKWKNIIDIAVGREHMVGLKSNGSVISKGYDNYGETDVKNWENIIDVEAGDTFSVGLKDDGTVVVAGYITEKGNKRIETWTDIVAISAGDSHLIGLKSDGTVVAVGDNLFNQCAVEYWTDIIEISAGDSCSVGLKSDGTVVSAGYTYYSVNKWSEIKEVFAGSMIFGIKKDGSLTVSEVDSGLGFDIQLKSNGKVAGEIHKSMNEDAIDDWKCDVSDWKNIVSIATTWAYSIGLKNDGTVVVDDAYHGYATQDHYIDTSSWKDIVAISGGYNHVVGLRSDGTVVAAGNNDEGQCNVEKWKDIVAIYADDECTIGIRDDGVAITTSSDYDYNYLQNKYGWKY